MATTFSREFLSVYPLNIGGGFGCTTVNQTIHTVPSGKIDEIWLYAVNNNATTDYVCTLQFPSNDIRTKITASSGLVLICPGLILNAGQSIGARQDLTNSQIVVYGFANRITVA